MGLQSILPNQPLPWGASTRRSVRPLDTKRTEPRDTLTTPVAGLPVAGVPVAVGRLEPLGFGVSSRATKPRVDGDFLTKPSRQIEMVEKKQSKNVEQ